MMRVLAKALILVLVFCVALAATVALSFTVKMLASRDATFRDITLAGVPNGRPKLEFACELATKELQALFSKPDLIHDLRHLNASISLSLIDLSPERAEIVRQLNEGGVPVTAWLALPREKGYYLNADNAADAMARFDAFERWTTEYGLRWAGIGLDIEPNLQDFVSARQGRWFHVAATMIRNCFDAGRISRARNEYATLIRKMQSEGYSVDTYQFPFIADERKVQSTVLERLFGIVNVRGDREALMTYSSFNRAVDSALVWEYGRAAQLLVVGVTAGDAEAGGKFRPLSWDEFTRDVIVASHFSPVVGVYSLEGCVAHGFMARIEAMDWTRSVTIPADAMKNVIRLRARIQVALWTASHLLYFVAAVVLLEAGMIWRRGRSPRTIARDE